MADSSEKSPVVPPEVRELIEESQKIQGWVERLAEHADEARPEVYRRVLSDYEGRLEKVTGRLAKHRADLVSNLEEHEGRVASLEEDRDAHAAELEEARLRHAVGEYSDDDWEARRSGIEDSIAELDERLTVEADAVRELSSIISSIGEGGTPAVEEVTAAAAKAAPAPEAGVESKEKTSSREPGPSPEKDVKEKESGRPAARTEREDETSEPKTEEAPQDSGKDDVPDAPKQKPATKEAPAAAKEAAGRKGTGAAEGTSKETDDEAASGEYLDELEFLESLSLEEAERFDAVSAMLDDDEAGNGKKES